MEQQDAKNLITLETFLESLKDIISGFKVYVEQINKRIDGLDKTIGELSKRINENTSITRETKRDAISKLDNLSRDINNQNSEYSKSLERVLKEISAFKTEFNANKTNSSKKSKKEADKKINREKKSKEIV